MVTARCEKCRFHGWLNGELCCDYIYITGRSRTAQMTKADRDRPCRFFESGKRVPIKEKPMTDSTAKLPRYRFDQRKMQELYDRGMTDGDIAREMGCSVSTVQNFRLQQKLPALRKKKDPSLRSG